jgi:NADPH:quinone reductase-like Zn-dependent oxidoreductase
MSTDRTMKAAVVEEINGPFEIRDVSRPGLKAGQVLVKIRASGVNPLDTKIRSGLAAHAKNPLPAILGMDMAGTVVAIGRGVTAFRVGDDVYGMIGGVGGRQGSLAEYVSADAALVALKPSNLSMRDAAAIPLVFITAWEGLVDRAKVHAGQKVLIQGGGGGVGHMAIQIANAFGAEVFATDGPKKADCIKSLNATPIDYTKQTPDEYIARYTGGRGFDLVYDTGGGQVLDASFAAVVRFGHVVSCLGWGQHSLAPLSFKAATYSGVFTLLPLLTGDGRDHHGEILTQATQLAEAKKLVPAVDPRRFTLADVASAHIAATDGSAKGKVIVEIGEI